MTTDVSVEKPTLVLISGFLGQASDWQPLQRALSADVRCVIADISWPFSQQPTSNTAPPDFMTACDQLFDRLVLQHELPPRFAVLGYSMGGRIALGWAQRHSDRIDQLILESCHPGLTTEAERLERLTSDTLWAQRFAKEPLEEVLTDWYQQPVFGHLTPTQRQAVIAQRGSQDSIHLGQVLAHLSLAIQPHFWALPQIPTAYISGGKDAKFSGIGQALLARNAALRLYQCADSGHNVHQEASEQFLAHIRPLLTRKPQTS